MRWPCVLAIFGLLSGCAMPAAFTVASFALDSGSYAMSGKTLSDHGLSLAAEEDCAMVRVLDEGEEVCQEQPGYEVAEGILTPLPEDGDRETLIAARSGSEESVGFAQLAQRVHQARTDRGNYLAAGMMPSAI